MNIKTLKKRRIKRQKIEKAIVAVNILTVRAIFTAATLYYYFKMNFPPYSLQFAGALFMTITLFGISVKEWVLGENG